MLINMYLHGKNDQNNISGLKVFAIFTNWAQFFKTNDVVSLDIKYGIYANIFAKICE